MLNPMLPDEVAAKEVPRQTFLGLKELFAFRKFQGIILVRRLHMFGQVLTIIWAVLGLLSVLAEGDVGRIIVAFITVPIFVIYVACMIRVFSELAISVLLAPSLLARSAGGNGRGTVNGTDADLAAYGVTGGADSGTIV